MAEPQPIWGKLYEQADDAGIVSSSRNGLAKMMTVIFAVCGSFGLPVSEAKTVSMLCLMTKPLDRVTVVSEAAGQVYKTKHQLLCI